MNNKLLEYRRTKLYKNLNLYHACAIVEAFDDELHSEAEIYTAWQWLMDNLWCWKLQGWYGRTANALIDMSYIEPRK
jgi:hypothetical protein